MGISKDLILEEIAREKQSGAAPRLAGQMSRIHLGHFFNQNTTLQNLQEIDLTNLMQNIKAIALVCNNIEVYLKKLLEETDNGKRILLNAQLMNDLSLLVDLFSNCIGLSKDFLLMEITREKSMKQTAAYTRPRPSTGGNVNLTV